VVNISQEIYTKKLEGIFMVDPIQGGGEVSPQDRALYRQEFERAVNLFQESLAAYQQSEIPMQKEEFKKVMDKTLLVIHQTIREAVKSRAEGKEKQLDQDYQNFLAQDTSQNVERLNHDLNDLKLST
jgi:hypothetical protein